MIVKRAWGRSGYEAAYGSATRAACFCERDRHLRYMDGVGHSVHEISWLSGTAGECDGKEEEVKLSLHTWRYGHEEWLEYHGRQWSFDPSNLVLEIFDPVLKDDKLGKRQVITVLSGEQFLVELCSHSCTLHTGSGDGERLIRRPDGEHIISPPSI